MKQIANLYSDRHAKDRTDLEYLEELIETRCSYLGFDLELSSHRLLINGLLYSKLGQQGKLITLTLMDALGEAIVSAKNLRAVQDKLPLLLAKSIRYAKTVAVSAPKAVETLENLCPKKGSLQLMADAEGRTLLHKVLSSASDIFGCTAKEIRGCHSTFKTDTPQLNAFLRSAFGINFKLGPARASDIWPRYLRNDDIVEQVLQAVGSEWSVDVESGSFGNTQSVRNAEPNKWVKLLETVFDELQESEEGVTDETCLVLCCRELPGAEDLVQEYRESFKVALRKAFLAAGYPHMTKLWRNLYRAYDPHAMNGFRRPLTPVEEYWLHRIVKKYGLTTQAYLLLSEKVNLPLEKIARHVMRTGREVVLQKARDLDLMADAPDEEEEEEGDDEEADE